jgi:radical SAM superfamily enzyme
MDILCIKNISMPERKDSNMSREITLSWHFQKQRNFYHTALQKSTFHVEYHGVTLTHSEINVVAVLPRAYSSEGN